MSLLNIRTNYTVAGAQGLDGAQTPAIFAVLRVRRWYYNLK